MEGHTIFLATIFSIIAVLGISGNTFLIAAVFLSMKLRNVTNAFVVTLSISDIINSCTLIVQVVALTGVRTDAFMIACMIVSPVAVILISTSFLLMTLIAFCRFVLITKQRHTFRRIFSQRNVAMMICISFLLPVTCTLVFICLDHATAGLNEDTICTFHGSPIYNVCGGGVLLVMLITVSVFYAKILVFLRRHFRRMRNQRSTQLTESSASVDTDTANETPRDPAPADNRNLELESKITKNMLLVLFVFAFCLLPMALALLLSDSALLGAYCFAVFNLSSCLNPFLFGWKHPVFRQVFLCMFRRKLDDIEEPATWLRKMRQKT